MKKKIPASSRTATLRGRAEEKLKKRKKEDRPAAADTDLRKLNHELQVHQIELELQNEELKKAHQELEASCNKYADLYDFAPVGYFTLDSKGTILEVNLTGSVMLGVERSLLANKPFAGNVAMDSQDIFYSHRQQLFREREQHRCEIALIKKDGTPLYALLESVPVADSGGTVKYCRTVVTDIIKRKRAEEALQQAHDELEQRVAERTRELRQANDDLRAEITGRKQAEQEIRDTRDFLENIYETSVDGILIADQFGYITKANKAITEMLGFNRGELIGKHTAELPLHDGIYGELALEIMNRLEEKGIVGNFEIPFIKKVLPERVWVTPRCSS